MYVYLIMYMILIKVSTSDELMLTGGLESQAWNDHYGVSPNIPKPSIFPANETETFMGIFHGELLNNQRVTLIETCHVGGVPCCTEFPDSIENFMFPIKMVVIIH